jgi:hypothetical protein
MSASPLNPNSAFEDNVNRFHSPFPFSPYSEEVIVTSEPRQEAGGGAGRTRIVRPAEVEVADASTSSPKKREKSSSSGLGQQSPRTPVASPRKQITPQQYQKQKQKSPLKTPTRAPPPTPPTSSPKRVGSRMVTPAKAYWENQQKRPLTTGDSARADGDEGLSSERKPLPPPSPVPFDLEEGGSSVDAYGSRSSLLRSQRARSEFERSSEGERLQRLMQTYLAPRRPPRGADLSFSPLLSPGTLDIVNKPGWVPIWERLPSIVQHRAAVITRERVIGLRSVPFQPRSPEKKLEGLRMLKDDEQDYIFSVDSPGNSPRKRPPGIDYNTIGK